MLPAVICKKINKMQQFVDSSLEVKRGHRWQRKDLPEPFAIIREAQKKERTVSALPGAADGRAG
jgi:hypothetical protein